VESSAIELRRAFANILGKYSQQNCCKFVSSKQQFCCDEIITGKCSLEIKENVHFFSSSYKSKIEVFLN
jgi:hypothetical protein